MLTLKEPLFDSRATYQLALQRWQAFQAQSTDVELRACLRNPEATAPAKMAAALRVLPPLERFPVAFGVFLSAARHWRPLEQTVFLGEFLPAPSDIERHILEAAARGTWIVPEKLPVTLDEFPSRIWKRAVASGFLARIAKAGHLAVLAMLRLLDQYQQETDVTGVNRSELDVGEEMEVRVPSGDLPEVFDLLGLPPSTFSEMKDRVIDRLQEDISAGRFSLTDGQMEAINAWTHGHKVEGSDHITEILNQASAILGKPLVDQTLHDIHHIRRLGRLLFRLGLRHEAMRCAKALGVSAWEEGWQFQTVTHATHSRVRKFCFGSGAGDNRWQFDPALACAAMTVPLWLTDCYISVASLERLFKKSRAFPWVFPRLFHIFQWSLACAGKERTLREVEAISPEFAIGLAKSPCPSIHP